MYVLLSVFLILIVAGCGSRAALTRPQFSAYEIGPPGAKRPSWAPGDTALVFSYWPSSSLDTLAAGLYTIRPDGSGMRLVAPGFYFTAQWSPDGSAIASEGTWRVVTLVDVATSDTTRIGPPGAAFPAWSPDASYLAFDSYFATSRGEHAVWIMARDGSSAHNISDTSTGEWRMPSWNNAGQLVIIRYYSGSDNPELAIIDTTGQVLVRLTNDDVSDSNPRWSPDGAHIAWTRDDGKGEHIWIMNVGSRLAWRVIEGREASWSSDGTRLAVTTGPALGATRLSIVRVDKP